MVCRRRKRSRRSIPSSRSPPTSIWGPPPHLPLWAHCSVRTSKSPTSSCGPARRCWWATRTPSTPSTTLRRKPTAFLRSTTAGSSDPWASSYPRRCMNVVTVATLNLFGKIARWDERLPLIVEQLTALEPDVIGLQEVVIADQGTLICRLANDRLAGPPHYRIFHMARPGAGAGVEALAVMSRLPGEAHGGAAY